MIKMYHIKHQNLKLSKTQYIAQKARPISIVKLRYKNLQFGPYHTLGWDKEGNHGKMETIKT